MQANYTPNMQETPIKSTEIANLIAEGASCFIFLGAGASIDSVLPENLRLPSGPEIKEYLLKRLEKREEDIKAEKSIVEVTPEVVWGEIIDKHSYNVGLNILKKIFEYDENTKIAKPTPSSYRFLAKLLLSDCITGVATTNFDEKLDEALFVQIKIKYRTKKLIVAATEEDFKEFDEKVTPIVYKFHGTLSKPYSIVSNPQGDLSNAKKKALSKLIRANDIVIFIGYSARDSDIREAIEHILKDEIDKSDAKRKHIYWCYHNLQGTRDSSIYPQMIKILSDAKDKRGFNVYYVPILDATAFIRAFWRNARVTREEQSIILGKEENFCRNRYTEYVQSKTEFPGRLTDPIYGYIDYNCSEEGWIDFKKEIANLMDCSAMQRMRNIKQLSLSYYIYPDGTHTRFAHSLGVAHLVLKALLKLRDSPIFKPTKTITKDVARNCIFAALLHDIGHGPYGHATEMFINRVGKSGKHEDYTIKIIDKGLLDLTNAFDRINFSRKDVKGFIDGSVDPKLFALHMLISNAGLDLDRLDFLLRDLYHTGRRIDKLELSIDPYSFEDRQKLINSLIDNLAVTTVDNLPEEGKNRFPTNTTNATCLCFNDTVMVKNYLDDFFKLYMEMYENVYYRDLNRCAQSMLSKALYLAYEIGEIEYEDVYEFTDPELFTLLENSLDSRVRGLIKCVKYRFLFEPICKFMVKEGVDLNSKMDLNEVENGLCNALGIIEEGINSTVIIDILPPKKIADSVYLKPENGEIITYNFRNRMDATTKGKYDSLMLWAGYLFVPQQLLDKKDRILDTFSEMHKDILKNVTRLPIPRTG